MTLIVSEAVNATMDVPSLDVTGSSETSEVWMFASATPAASTAEITARVAVALRPSAAAAVAAFVCTVKEKEA